MREFKKIQEKKGELGGECLEEGGILFKKSERKSSKIKKRKYLKLGKENSKT